MSEQQPPASFSGLWTIQQPNGARIEMEYSNGVPNGVYRSWHQHGVCLREGFTKNGEWHGTLITRAADATVLDVSEFDEGTGTYRIFNSNHQLTDEVPLVHGKPHGSARYSRLGKLLVTKFYDHGQCKGAIFEA